LTTERDRLAEENAQLQAQLSASSTYHTPPFPTSAPNTPPSFSPNGFVKSTALSPQHTGDSAGSDDTVAHTSFSHAGSDSFTVDDNGWWGAE
jgi:hypothetical protein